MITKICEKTDFTKKTIKCVGGNLLMKRHYVSNFKSSRTKKRKETYVAKLI